MGPRWWWSARHDRVGGPNASARQLPRGQRWTRTAGNRWIPPRPTRSRGGRSPRSGRRSRRSERCVEIRSPSRLLSTAGRRRRASRPTALLEAGRYAPSAHGGSGAAPAARPDPRARRSDRRNAATPPAARPPREDRRERTGCTAPRPPLRRGPLRGSRRPGSLWARPCAGARQRRDARRPPAQCPRRARTSRRPRPGPCPIGSDPRPGGFETSHRNTADRWLRGGSSSPARSLRSETRSPVPPGCPGSAAEGCESARGAGPTIVPARPTVARRP